MAYVVLNSLGVGTWDSSFASVGSNGRWVAFGGLTGADVKLKSIFVHKTNQINWFDWWHQKRTTRT